MLDGTHYHFPFYFWRWNWLYLFPCNHWSFVYCFRLTVSLPLFLNHPWNVWESSSKGNGLERRNRLQAPLPECLGRLSEHRRASLSVSQRDRPAHPPLRCCLRLPVCTRATPVLGCRIPVLKPSYFCPWLALPVIFLEGRTFPLILSSPMCTGIWFKADPPGITTVFMTLSLQFITTGKLLWPGLRAWIRLPASAELNPSFNPCGCSRLYC